MALTTWACVLSDTSVLFVEHPAMSTLMPKAEIHKELGSVLIQLDCTTPCDAVSTFYQRDPVNPTVLRFRDDDARLDILEWLEEENSLSFPDSDITQNDVEMELARVRMRKQNQEPTTQLATQQKKLAMMYEKAKYIVNEGVQMFFAANIAKAESKLADIVRESARDR